MYDDAYPREGEESAGFDDMVCRSFDVGDGSSVEARRTALDAYLYHEHENNDVESSMPYYYGKFHGLIAN